jgi:hypothetical protein
MTWRMKGRQHLTMNHERRSRPLATRGPALIVLCGMIAAAASACGGSSSSGGSTPPPAPDSFASTAGNMKWSRIGALLAGLTNGSILIAGGYDNALETVTQAELYRPPRKTFKSAGAPLMTARYLATATTLSNGTVLIAGGVDQSGTALAGAEIYDPSTGTFRATAGDMTDSRMGAVAALLPSGQVLIAGGLDANGQYLGTAELYNPSTDSFAPSLGTMSETRQYATATLLPNGLVLVAGGVSAFCASFSCQDADLYDPATDAFTPSASEMSEARGAATATLLSTGKVLIAGGQIDGQTPTNSADLYDPATDTFAASQGVLSTSRAWAVASALPDGKVLLAGGLETDPLGASATADLYDPVTDIFTPSASQMTDSRAYAVATPLSNGTVLIAGGLDSAGNILSTADIYYP